MRRYDHVVWDWNGTIVDDTWLCIELLNVQLAKKRLPALTVETYRDVFGFPMQAFYSGLGLSDSPAEFEQLNRAFLADYNRRRYECRLHGGVEESMEALERAGAVSSILSAYATVHLSEMVDHYGLRSHFHHVMGLDNTHAAGKTEEGKRLVGQLGCDRSRILMVGDTVHDFEVSRALGVECVLIARGHQSSTRLLACGASVLESAGEVAVVVSGDANRNAQAAVRRKSNRN